MIARIEGKLLRLNESATLIQLGQVSYEIMVPGYLAAELSSKIGSDIVLYTLEYYEGSPGGSNFIPRMVGFLSLEEKDFFNKFISVKGIGIKKALKLLTVPIATIAAAIESGDEKILISLPSVGKRLAQHIIAELKGKLESYAAGAELASGTTEKISEDYQLEALEILIAWGEKRNEAIELIALAAGKYPQIKSAEELVPLVYRLKQGIQV